MHGTSRTKSAEKPGATGVNAVVWIEPGRALIVRGGAGAELTSLKLPIPSTPAVTPPALAEVAHSIGAVDRVLVLGADELRTALERRSRRSVIAPRPSATPRSVAPWTLRRSPSGSQT